MTLATWSRAFEGMQPRRRQTPPRPRFEVDQGDLHSQIGGQKRGGVSARSAADDNKLCVHEKGLGIGD